MSDDELRALAAQLACPHGEQALAVAERMNEVNLAIIAESIAALAPGVGETIVEIGPGNGLLSAPLVAMLGPSGRYIGLERSAAMAAEAQAFLARCDGAPVDIRIADCLSAALPVGSVDGLLAVNLLYFIADLDALFARLHSWLKPTGRVVFGVRSPAALRTLPFTQYGFHIRSLEQIVDALARSGFASIDHWDHADTDAAGSFTVVRGNRH